MSEIRETTSKPRRGRGPFAYAIAAFVLIGIAAVLYVIGAAVIRPPGQTDIRSLAHGEMAKLSMDGSGQAPPTTNFLDAQGHPVTLADLKAPVMVVNLWATWCAPCVREMPTLAALQASYPGHVKVVALSMDKLDDREQARAFIASHPPLDFYQDTKLAMPFALSPAAEGFPTTILYDRTGHERARLSGAADWNSADARAVIEALLAQK